MRKIHLAGPLFSLAEKEFNLRLAKALSGRLENVEIVLLQEGNVNNPSGYAIFKYYNILGKSINARGFDPIITITAQMMPTQAINQNYDDVHSNHLI